MERTAQREQGAEESRNENKNERREKGSKGTFIKYAAVVIVTLLVVFAARAFLFGNTVNPVSASQQQGLGTGADTTTGTGTQGSGSPIEVRVTMTGYNYQPNPIRLKVGVPARLVVDLNTVGGCMRSIQIPGLGVSKYVSPGDNVIEFTPTKAGTFRMQCSMGMGQGVVIVEDATGAVPAGTNDLASAPAAGGSCGAGGGGCGCGGAR